MADTQQQRLDVICAGGAETTWTGRHWRPHSAAKPGGYEAWTLTGDDVRAVFRAIRINERAGKEQRYAITAALGLVGDYRGKLSHRKVDRALQLLRKAGLIRHRDGRWEVCDG